PAKDASAEVAALVSRAALHMNRQELDEAIAALREATSKAPKDGRAWFILGQAYFLADRLDESVAACRQAIALEPRTPGYWAGLSATHRKMGDLAGAIEGMKQLLARAPDDERGCGRCSPLQLQAG